MPTHLCFVVSIIDLSDFLSLFVLRGLKREIVSCFFEIGIFRNRTVGVDEIFIVIRRKAMRDEDDSNEVDSGF